MVIQSAMEELQENVDNNFKQIFKRFYGFFKKSKC